MQDTVKPHHTLVIPCYNEQSRLGDDLFTPFLREHQELRIIFVDDGSTDDTGTILRLLKEKGDNRISVLSLEQNSGKAEAVRRGMLDAAAQEGCTSAAYWDADLATPLDELPRFLSTMEEDPKLKLICGSRIKHMGVNIERHWYRHYFGRAFATAASQILHIPIYDTQCGAKLLPSTVIPQLFDRPFVSRWLFDVELIARLITLCGREQAMRSIREIPLRNWSDRGDSKFSLLYLPRVPLDLLKIHRAYRQHLRRDRAS